MKALIRRVVTAIPFGITAWRATLGRGYPDSIRAIVQRPVVLRLAGQELGAALEIGSGEGMYTSVWDERSRSLVFTDIGYEGVAALKARALYRSSGVVCDAQQLPFRAGTFDTVLMTEVLEHLPHDEATLAAIHTLLRPSGRLLLSVPVPPAPVPDPNHVREGYVLADLQALLTRTGYTVSSYEYCQHWLGCAPLPYLQRGSYLPIGALRVLAVADRWLRVGNPYGLVVAARKFSRLATVQEGEQTARTAAAAMATSGS